MSKLKIYTDGSASPNPGPGGCGIVAVSNVGIKYWYGGYKEETTNNVMELTAIKAALELADILPTSVTIFSDSTYAIYSIRKWAYVWKKNGWKKNDGQEITNKELIISVHELYEKLKSRVKLRHVKGHSGDTFNELADKLANKAREDKQEEITSIDII